MLNTPRRAIRSMLSQGILAALLGMTLGCARSPSAPTPQPPTPVPVTRPGYSLTTSTNIVAPGGQLSVSWTTSNAGHNDWIALFKKGDTNMGRTWFVGWTEGAASGSFTLGAPNEPGEYEFRYLLDDGFGDAAVSNLVTVAASARPAYNRGP